MIFRGRYRYNFGGNEAHVIVAVVAPGLGDEIQAMKAGLLEVADIVVVNKADNAGANQTINDLAQWVSNVIRTVVRSGRFSNDPM